jgi:uncharacterized protein YaiL (DUF2058 family)
VRSADERGKIAPVFFTESSRFMSMSLRDQLLAAGLVTAKQAREAERQQQRQQLPKHKRESVAEQPRATRPVQSAKVARDQALSRQQQEKAERKARQAQIRQLVEQNKLPKLETEEFYNFVDGNKVRRIWADASIRERLRQGEIAIARHDGRYELVPAAIAARIRERDERAVILSTAASDSAQSDDAYKEFTVPDDLIW